MKRMEKMIKERQLAPNEEPQEEEEINCGFCYDNKRHANIDLYFLDRANNMRVCKYCPYCGRALE